MVSAPDVLSKPPKPGFVTPLALRNVPPMSAAVGVTAMEWTSLSILGLNAVALLFFAKVIVPVAGVVGLPPIGKVKCVASTTVIGPWTPLYAVGVAPAIVMNPPLA